MEFKDRLKELRKSAKISGEALGKIVGVQKSSISNWEKGRNFPETKTIQLLAEFFNVTVDYLMGNPEPREDSSTKEYIDVTGLSDEDIEALSLIVERLKEKNNG